MEQNVYKINPTRAVEMKIDRKTDIADALKFSSDVITNGMQFWCYIRNVYANEKKKVIVVIFKDGTKRIVRCAKGDTFSVYAGVCIAIAEKVYGSNTKLKKAIKEAIHE